jgi:hypothetical protein
MKHFLSRDMLAVNVITFPVDATVIAEFADPSRLPGRLISVAPKRDKWHSDIEWISPDDEEGFAFFESAFQRLGIPQQAAPYLDLDREVRLYFGFLVTRSRCTEPYFHCDWRGENNEAFTFMSPVTANTTGFGLLYKKLTGETAEYEYRSGEAIMFGDNFEHSTKPGISEKPAVLLSFEFGTDRMEHWPGIYDRLRKQATLLRQPDGRFVRTGREVSRVVR